jgi:hypothetical protein
MSASPKSVLRTVAFSVASVAFPVASVASPVASVASPVASECPRSVIARALLRARKERQANKVKRIADRRSFDVANRNPGFVPRTASVQGNQASVRLH